MSVVEERGVAEAGEQEGGEKRVAPLELFFDLVFVFALTQITYLMSENPTWEGLGQGMLVLIALWWAWGAYAWLTNYIDTERDTERLLMLAAMVAMLVAALATPHAFGDDALIFAVAYAAVRWLHIFIFAEANEHVDTAGAIRTLARTALPAPLLLIGAAFFDGAAQAAVWIVALGIDYAGPFVFGVRGFRVSAGHFAERFGLIVIIALGESIVAIGAGISGVDLDAGLIAAAVFGVVLSAALWWAYFDVVAIAAEHRFRETAGRCPGADGTRLLQLDPPADDRRHPARGARSQEDARRCRRAAQDRAGGRSVRRDGALLRGARRFPAAQSA